MNNSSEPITNTHEVGAGSIGVYFSNDDHRYTTFCDHGATTSGVTYISVSNNGHCSIHWPKGIYRYEGGNALAIVATFAATLSMGKMANYIKRTGSLVRMTPFDAHGDLDFDNRVEYEVAA